MRRRTAEPVLTAPFFLFVQPSHWRAFDMIGVRCVLHLPFLSIRITLWMDLVVAADDNAFDVGELKPLIPTWLAVGAVVFLIRDSVFTKCGDTSAGCEFAMGKFGSDCGAASILCTDMLRFIIPPLDILLEPMAWPLIRRWLVPFITFIDESVTIRSSSVWMRLEFVWMKTPSHVIFIVVTILLVACEIAFVCHALHNCSLIACRKLRPTEQTRTYTHTQIAFSPLLMSLIALSFQYFSAFCSFSAGLIKLKTPLDFKTILSGFLCFPSYQLEFVPFFLVIRCCMDLFYFFPKYGHHLLVIAPTTSFYTRIRTRNNLRFNFYISLSGIVFIGVAGMVITTMIHNHMFFPLFSLTHSISALLICKREFSSVPIFIYIKLHTFYSYLSCDV